MYFKLLFIVLACSVMHAKMHIRTDGYVKLDAFFDSRQVFGIADDQAMLFPRARMYDPSGRDTQDRAQFQQTAVESRLQIFVTTDETFFGAIPFGSIESNFTGNFFEAPNILSMIYSYFGLLTDTWKVYFGQYWHPLAPQECFPQTVGYACGTPIDCYARNPQIRVTVEKNGFELWFSALAQRDYQSFGPLPGGFSTEYLRNSAIPNLNLHMRARIGSYCLAGVCGDFKKIVPRLETETGLKANESNTSFVFAAYTVLTFEKSILRLKSLYAQNANDFIMLSGYAVKTIDPHTDHRTYANTAVATVWADYTYRFTWGDIGGFSGISKNLGSQHPLYVSPVTNQPIVYNYEPRIDISFKFVPRFIWRSYPVTFGLELWYDYTSYGALNNYAKPVNTIPVQSVRLLLGSYYYF